MNPFFTLAPGDANSEVDSAIEFTQDAHIYAMFPHTHLRGKSWAYQLVYPDGHKQEILSGARTTISTGRPTTRSRSRWR